MLLALMLFSVEGYAFKEDERGDISANSEGYIDSNVCASCHLKQFDGFQHVGMSQSFKEASSNWFTPEKRTNLPFFHKKSQRYYDFQIENDKIIFVRYQLDESVVNDAKTPVPQDKRVETVDVDKKTYKRFNEIRVKVDYLLGSGNKTTSLIYRTNSNELYQLPLNWYSEGEFWDMSPGFDLPDHQGIQRQVTRECMFCHNAYPLEDMKHDQFWQRDTFPEVLPEGIGCQRCHGPGGKHVQEAMSVDTTLANIRASIVNPAKLPHEERDAVCFQCHMQPSVGLSGVRNYQRSDYSFRPGEKLSEYLVHLDIVDAQIPKMQRFEINHHGYRLSTSECFTQSSGELACISCHNPHEKPSAAKFVKQVEEVCWSCHQPPEVKAKHEAIEIEEQQCVTCHMPQRRAQDVINVVMTDHKIGVYENVQQNTQPVIKREHEIIAAEILDSNLEMSEIESNIYKLSAILNNISNAEYVNVLKSLLQRSSYLHIKPYLDLAQAELTLKRFGDSLSTLNYAKQRFGSNTRLEELRALNLLSSDEHTLSEDIFVWLLQQDPKDQSTLFNLGLLKYKQEKYKEALHLFNKASQLSENFAGSHYYAALIHRINGDIGDAIESLLRTIAIDPGMERAYHELMKTLHSIEDKETAIRYYKLGLRFARQPGILRKSAQELGLQIDS